MIDQETLKEAIDAIRAGAAVTATAARFEINKATLYGALAGYALAISELTQKVSEVHGVAAAPVLDPQTMYPRRRRLTGFFEGYRPLLFLSPATFLIGAGITAAVLALAR